MPTVGRASCLACHAVLCFVLCVQVGEAEQAIATITSKLPALEAQLASLRAQLGTPLSSTLSASEQKEIE